MFGGDGANLALPPEDEDVGASGARRRRRMGAGRARHAHARGARSRRRCAGQRPRRARRALRALARRVLRDVHRRRTGLGGTADEVRRLPGPGRRGRRAPGPDGLVLPLLRDRSAARRHPLAHRRAERAGRPGGFRAVGASVSGGRGERLGCRSACSGGRPGAALAAGRVRPRGEGDAADRRVAPRDAHRPRRPHARGSHSSSRPGSRSAASIRPAIAGSSSRTPTSASSTTACA